MYESPMIFQARPVARGHGFGEGVHQEEVCPVVPPAPHSLGSCIGGKDNFSYLLSFHRQGLTDGSNDYIDVHLHSLWSIRDA